MAKWTDVVAAEDVPEGGKVCAQAEESPVVICRVQDQWFAVRNVCPHAGMPLGDGDLSGHVLTCPYHGYAYNIKNGRNIDWPYDELPAKTYPVRVENGTVQVNLEPDDRQHPEIR